jgi:hypothetical protein
MVLLAACSSEQGDSDKCEVGEEQCACYANGTCNEGLECFSKLCVSRTGTKPNEAGASEDAGADEPPSASPDKPSKPSSKPSSKPTSADAGSDAPAASDPTNQEPSTSSEPDSPTTPVVDSDEPYALGTVNVNLSKAPGNDLLSLLAVAGFSPHIEPGVTSACETKIGACRLGLIPDCDCADDEYCGFDENCDPACLPQCTLSCSDGQICYFDASQAPKCGPIERFDAGSLRLSGGVEPFTMDYPYSHFESSDTPWFDSGAKLTLTATGSSDAGFAAFSQDFKATKLLATGLAELTRAEVFGPGDITFKWTAGSDHLTFALTLVDTDGGSALLNCDANDAQGSFVLPRTTIVQALRGKDLLALSASVSRTRTEVYSGFETTGSLPRSSVEAKGWLQLSSVATETRSFQQCTADESECGLDCIDLSTNVEHCGSCDRACPAAASGCKGGACVCLDGAAVCGEECVDLSTDSNHCGKCTTTCDSNSICDNGVCTSCPKGQSACDEECIDLQTDDYNCGKCGNECSKACGPDGNSLCEGTCSGGVCLYDSDCPAGQEACPVGGCKDLDNDPANCGDCGHECASDKTCSGGSCVTPVWNCDPDLRGDGDCDCGCGSVDPDCTSNKLEACGYCYCDDPVDPCDPVDPNDNGQCIP